MNVSFQEPRPEPRLVTAMFVKFTSAYDDKLIYINVNMVESYCEATYNGRKVTELTVSSGQYRVKELPERVAELIWQARY